VLHAYDVEDKKWIRSGKVAGAKGTVKQSFSGKNDEHKKASSRICITISKFNKSYRLKGGNTTSEASETSMLRKRYFDNLIRYCAFGFDRNTNIESLTNLEDGIFSFDRHTIEMTTQAILGR